jgi:hypothetical protein
MSSKQSLHALKLQRSPSTQPVQLTICTRRRCRTNHESHTQTNRRQTIHCCRGRGPDARPHTCQRTSLQDMRPVGWPRSHNWQRMSGESCREAIGLGLALSALTTEARDIAKCANWLQNKPDMTELSRKATRNNIRCHIRYESYAQGQMGLTQELLRAKRATFTTTTTTPAATSTPAPTPTPTSSRPLQLKMHYNHNRNHNQHKLQLRHAFFYQNTLSPLRSGSESPHDFKNTAPQRVHLVLLLFSPSLHLLHARSHTSNC